MLTEEQIIPVSVPKEIADQIKKALSETGDAGQFPLVITDKKGNKLGVLLRADVYGLLRGVSDSLTRSSDNKGASSGATVSIEEFYQTAPASSGQPGLRAPKGPGGTR